MKDLAYFASSCMYEEHCARQETRILDAYFDALRRALEVRESPVDFSALRADWQTLYRVAWTDFHRFYKGWSPGHFGHGSYSERLASQVIERLTRSGEAAP